MLNIGWDTETYLISAENIIPPIVCSTWDCAQQGTQESDWRRIECTGDGLALFNTLLRMVQAGYDEEARIIIHNAAFDVTVLLKYCQDVIAGTRPGDRSKAMDLFLLIWDVLEKSMDNEWENCQNIGKNGYIQKPILISCTLLREKLGNLSYSGTIAGKQYSLAAILYRRLKVDIRDKKVSIDGNGRVTDVNGLDITGTAAAAASWRLRYKLLDGIPLSEWPQEAIEYAISDATYARWVWDDQEAHRKAHTYHSMNSESLQVYTDITLRLTTATGFHIDQKQVKTISESINGRLQQLEPILIENGIIRSNGTANMRLVKGIVEEVWGGWLGRKPLLTEKGEIATNKEVMELISQFDPRLQVFAERQLLNKVRTAFLPKLQGTRVYTNFDALKETGRTSSTGSSNKKGPPAYEAINSQQVPRRPGVRECFIAPPPDANAPQGYFIASVDYSMMELCSVGQSTYNILGYSTHRDRINDGYDLHTFLGSRLAMIKEPALVGHHTDPKLAYEYMLERLTDYVSDDDNSSEAQDRKHLKSRAKHFRDLAKPVGLGYPGGLGAKTMVVFARTVYKVNITLEESEEFKAVWLDLYPEMPEYFKWVNKQTDHRNKDEDGKSQYGYATPGFFRFRAGASYCATSNGASMQSLGADGAKRSVCWLQRAMCGAIQGNNPYRILDKCQHLSFIHDENLIAIPIDAMVTERALAAQNLMIDALAVHMPDVQLKAEPALMRRWTKKAEPVWRQEPGAWNTSMNLISQEYGDAIAHNAADQFRSNVDDRLHPWDDFHKWEVE